jgi:O-antigen/teichoic acid export membrane protein
VLTAPAVSILVAGYYAARLPRPQSVHDWKAIRQQWQAMLKLGIPLMAAGMLAMTTQMIVRSIIVRELGVDASGHFQAAWAISMTYIGIVLGAMVTDYYPRLTASVNDHSQARRLVNEQTEMGLLMVGPILLGIITFAPWVIHLLYAKSFLPASELLRWQVMGDALKVAIAPMRYISLAQGRGGVFIATELIWNIAYLGAIVLGIQEYGLLMAGVGFLIAYLVYLLAMIFVAAKLIQHQITTRISMLLLIILIAGGLIIFFNNQYGYTGYWFGFLVTLALSGYSLYRLNGLIDIQGWLKRKFLN